MSDIVKESYIDGLKSYLSMNDIVWVSAFQSAADVFWLSSIPYADARRYIRNYAMTALSSKNERNTQDII